MLFLHDLRTHETRGSGAQAEQKYELAQDACLFQSDERHDFFGDDLNGDGDTGDRILRVFGWASGRVLDLGLALLASGQAAEAAERLNTAAALNAPFDVHRHLARAYAALGQTDESQKAQATYERLRREAISRTGKAR